MVILSSYFLDPSLKVNLPQDGSGPGNFSLVFIGSATRMYIFTFALIVCPSTAFSDGIGVL